MIMQGRSETNIGMNKQKPTALVRSKTTRTVYKGYGGARSRVTAQTADQQRQLSCDPQGKWLKGRNMARHHMPHLLLVENAERVSDAIGSCRNGDWAEAEVGGKEGACLACQPVSLV
ncbi:hypothetical protein J3459_012404 [Metarhizium acridum]|nr:hypothetical protein J3459_012404 [Metarhizium acridum]